MNAMIEYFNGGHNSTDLLLALAVIIAIIISIEKGIRWIYQKFLLLYRTKKGYEDEATTINNNTEQIKNLAKSLSKNEIKIADIGSGGGLPGIPLAIVLPEFQFFLVERMDKRCAFLENEKAILSLDNVTVIKSEAEKIASESFDITTFRAFRPLDSHFADTLLKITKPGGFLAAFKAKKSSIESEMSAIKTIIKEYKIFPLEVPFLTDSTEKKECRERNLVVVKKNI